MNVPVIFMENGAKVHPRFRGNNLVTRYGLSEGSCVVPNKSVYMDDDNCAKAVKVIAPGIRKMKVINVACVFPILFSIHITVHLCTSILYAYYM